ncbi:MAG: hypothetical protein C0501_09420 [Isosphaera sp.]|nr:hypothetical protein [Isosphaera sp.]
MPPVCLAALVALCPSEPPIPVPLPIPTYRPPTYQHVTEASLAGTTHRVRWAPAEGIVGDWEELAFGRDTGRRTRKWFIMNDYQQTAAVTGPRTAGLFHQVFVANHWSVDLELEAGPSGPRVKVGVSHYPREGITVGVGFSSRDGVTAYAANSFSDDDLAAARFWPRVAALQLLEAARVVVGRVCPPAARLLPDGR